MPVIKQFLRASFLISAASGVSAAAATQSAELRFDHQISLQYDFTGGKQTPVWSGGAILALEGNHTAAPQILRFGQNGTQEARFLIAVPGSTNIDVAGWARGTNGVLAVCGSAYDQDGRESGFLGILDEVRGNLTAVRLTPYEPFRVVVASDGSLWTTGMEMVGGKESGTGISPDHGVLRHFDASGKLLASYLPRSLFPSNRFLTWGWLVAGVDRIGWYTGPVRGPGSLYYEISQAGEIRSFPALPLTEDLRVNGIGLTDSGRTYVSIFDTTAKSSALKSIAAGEKGWRTESLTPELEHAKFFKLYGANSKSLVFWREQPSTVAFVKTPEEAR